LTPPEVLGTVAAEVVLDLIGRGETGLRLIEVTQFDYMSFLNAMVASASFPHVVLAGRPASELKRLATGTGFPLSQMTGDLEVGTAWRNDPMMKGTIVVVSFAEEEKLGTFHRFTAVKDHDLYQGLCRKGLAELGPNEVLTAWWKLLMRRDVERQLSVRRLAEYLIYLQANKKSLPEAARTGLYILGMLPSRTFFDSATPGQLHKQFIANRHLLGRIEALSLTDRNRLSKSLEHLSGSNKTEFQATIGRVLRYTRSGRDEDRSALWAEDVTKILESSKKSRVNKPEVARAIGTEKAAIEAIFSDEEARVEEIGERLREELAKQEEEPTPQITIELPNRDGQAFVQISTPLLSLLRRSITADCLGGIFRCLTVDSLEQALDELDRADFQPFLVRGDKTPDSRIRAIVTNKYVEPEFLDTWEEFCTYRRVLAADVALLAVSPLVALASNKGLSDAAEKYLRAYERLLGILKDRFEILTQKSPKGVRTLGAQILAMDTVMIHTRSGLKALLSPLHPLHIWKFGKRTKFPSGGTARLE
jgi:hypothetical protein